MMYKININGVTRPMEEKEIAALEREKAEMNQPEPTPEELITQQAQEIAYLREALELILSGATEVESDG